jgi:hypothetical protein
LPQNRVRQPDKIRQPDSRTLLETMKFAKSELLGIARAENGWLYNLDFYGETEGAAVVSGTEAAARWRHDRGTRGSLGAGD